MSLTLDTPIAKPAVAKLDIIQVNISFVEKTAAIVTVFLDANGVEIDRKVYSVDMTTALAGPSGFKAKAYQLLQSVIANSSGTVT